MVGDRFVKSIYKVEILFIKSDNAIMSN